jgi:hypothetical protein
MNQTIDTTSEELTRLQTSPDMPVYEAPMHHCTLLAKAIRQGSAVSVLPRTYQKLLAESYLATISEDEKQTTGSSEESFVKFNRTPRSPLRP